MHFGQCISSSANDKSIRISAGNKAVIHLGADTDIVAVWCVVVGAAGLVYDERIGGGARDEVGVVAGASGF